MNGLLSFKPNERVGFDGSLLRYRKLSELYLANKGGTAKSSSFL